MLTGGGAVTWTWMAQSDWQAYDAWPSAELRVEHSRRKQAKVENDRKWREANAEHIQAKAEERQRDAARSAWKYSAERKAAAGAEHVTSWSSVARLERRKGDAAKAEAEMEVDARRKRVRRINDEKEDRDALRELASSRNDCAHLELEQTPYAASDRTPHLASRRQQHRSERPDVRSHTVQGWSARDSDRWHAAPRKGGGRAAA